VWGSASLFISKQYCFHIMHCYLMCVWAGATIIYLCSSISMSFNYCIYKCVFACFMFCFDAVFVYVHYLYYSAFQCGVFNSLCAVFR